jgi:hypothetical protein
MANYRVIVNGDVYQVPKANVGSQAEAEAAVRDYIKNVGGVQQTGQRKSSTKVRDILAGLTQGASLGASDEILGRAESFIRNVPAANTIERRRDDIRQAAQNSPLAFLGAEVAGSVIPTALALRATKGKQAPAASKIGELGQKIMANPYGRAAAVGGAEGAVAGFNTGEGDAMQRLPGAAVGGALGAGLGSFAEFAQPRISEKAIELAKKYAIPLSPASLGDSGKALEMAARQVPFVGGEFRKRREETLDAFNTAVVNEVLKGTGRAATKISAGRDAYTEAAEQVGKAYDEILGSVDSIQLGGSLVDLASEGLEGLPKKAVKAINKRLKAIDDRANSAEPISGKKFKEVDSLLRELIATYQKGASNPDPLTKLESVDIRDALIAFRQDMLDAAGAAVGGDFAARLRGADFAYKKLQVLRKISEGRGTAERFTPKQLQAAVSQLMRKEGDQVARGTAPLQQLADQAADELSDLEYSTARDSTVVRLLTEGGPLAAGATAIGADYGMDQDLETQTMLGAGSTLAGLGLLAGLSRPGVYRNIPQMAQAAGTGLNRGLQYSAPLAGMAAGSLLNEDQ